MDKFKNKYRIPSARLQTWDYGSNGTYFVTICTHNRQHFFGEIVPKAPQGNAGMELNAIGQLAEKIWLEIPQHFPFVELGNFVIMPNHTHGILIINKSFVNDDAAAVETQLIASLPNDGGFAGNKNPMINGNISRIIRWYKGRCSFEMRRINSDFAWQARFHDHIIRNADAFERIQTYIENNPQNWNNDQLKS